MPRQESTVVLIGTLDTKGPEHAFVRDRLREAGVAVVVIDVGVLGEPGFRPDETAADVARAAGTTQADVRRASAAGDARADALDAMARGATAIVAELRARGRCAGVMGLGGSGGSTIVSAVLRSLPIGVPKLLVSTMTSGNVRPYVGSRDLMLVNPVTDIQGLNRISRLVLTNAANAMAGMVLGPGPDAGTAAGTADAAEAAAPAGSTASGGATAPAGSTTPAGSTASVRATGSTAAAATTPAGAPLVAITMMGVTTPGAQRVQRGLEAAGFETIVFHANGAGGMALEETVDDGAIDGVVDLTTSELTSERFGGVVSAGPSRLTAAGRAGIPQVVAPGALEVANFGPRSTVPPRFDGPDRRIVIHSPVITSVRVNAAEAAEMGRLLAEKVNRATGPTAVVLPLGGCSMFELPGGPFIDPGADAALFGAIRESLRPGIACREVAANINEQAFADLAVATFLELWATTRPLPAARSAAAG